MVVAQYVLGTLEGVPCDLSGALDASLCLCFYLLCLSEAVLASWNKALFPSFALEIHFCSSKGSLCPPGMSLVPLLGMEQPTVSECALPP